MVEGDRSEAFYAMVGRALSDTEYREELLNRETREIAFGRAGLEWTSDLDEKLEAARAAIDSLAADYGTRSAAAT